jgi:hypothetical protein
MTGLLVVAAFVVLALLTLRYGADSRDGADWRSRDSWLDNAVSRRRRTASSTHGRRTVSSDLRALVGLLRRLGQWSLRAWDRQERAWGACWRAHQPWRGDDLADRNDELHWRQVNGGWRLVGRLLPVPPPTDWSKEPSGRRD